MTQFILFCAIYLTTIFIQYIIKMLPELITLAKYKELSHLMFYLGYHPKVATSGKWSLKPLR